MEPRRVGAPARHRGGGQSQGARRRHRNLGGRSKLPAALGVGAGVRVVPGPGDACCWRQPAGSDRALRHRPPPPANGGARRGRGRLRPVVLTGWPIPGGRPVRRRRRRAGHPVLAAGPRDGDDAHRPGQRRRVAAGQQRRWSPPGVDEMVSLYDVRRDLVRASPLPASGTIDEGQSFLMPAPDDEVVVLNDEGPGHVYPLDPAEWLALACDGGRQGPDPGRVGQVPAGHAVPPGVRGELAPGTLLELPRHVLAEVAAVPRVVDVLVGPELRRGSASPRGPPRRPVPPSWGPRPPGRTRCCPMPRRHRRLPLRRPRGPWSPRRPCFELSCSA